MNGRNWAHKQRGECIRQANNKAALDETETLGDKVGASPALSFVTAALLQQHLTQKLTQLKGYERL